MSNTITIDLDSLSEERAEKLAGFILTYAGVEGREVFTGGEYPDPTVKISVDSESESESDIQRSERQRLDIKYAPEPTPAEVFSNISSAGPTLVIPSPPSASIVQMNPQPSQAAGIAVGTPAPAVVSNVSASSTGTTVDKTGLPWDSRIHSAAKTFNADGTWRARRGLADGYANQIERELRQLMAIPSPQYASTVVAASPGVPASITAASGPVDIPRPPLPGAVASPSLQPYLDLMNKVSSALAGGRITSVQLQKVCEAVGLPTFVSLGTRLDLVPTVAPMIDGILAGNQ